MFQQFVNREGELRLLEDTYKQYKSSLIIIYGRRRIGKTELIKQFIKDKKHIYFLADTRTDRGNIKETQKAFWTDCKGIGRKRRFEGGRIPLL